jgi:hypothetical protein
LSKPGDYRACPATTSFAPGRAFKEAEEALAFAREAADRWRVPYAVWAFRGSAWEVISRVTPSTSPAGRRLKALWACQECGRKFKSTAAAQCAADRGCPRCGGVDVDLAEGGRP